MDIMAGYSRKIEEVGRFPEYDVDFHRVKYL
jgi:hypothetical protein